MKARATERPSLDRRLLAEARGGRAPLAGAVALGLAGVAATIAQWALLSAIVDGVYRRDRDLAAVAPLLALLAAAIVARAGATWLRERAAQAGALAIATALRERLFAHLLRLGPAYTAGERTGELVASATDGIERLRPYFGRYLPQLAIGALAPLLVAGAALPADPLSAGILLATAPVIVLLLILVGGYAAPRIERQWRALTFLQASFLDTIQGLATLQTFGRGAAERARVAHRAEGYRQRTMTVLRYAFLSGLVLEFMSTAGIALVAVTLGVRVLNGHVPFERAFFVLLLTPEFYRPFRDLGAHRHAGMEGKAAAERIFAILDTPLPVTSAPAASAPSLAVAPAITFSNVCFTYPGAATPALDGVTLTLPAGSRTALVGASGAGKTTLLNLLLRFAEPTGGTIMADGVPLAAWSPAAWRAGLALVPQRPYLFAGSVRDTIRLARPDAGEDDVRRAAELAGAAAFITALPQGYDTPVGERGARLSRGQAQRIAIARAFLKDASLLILDEPTATLDPESEDAIRAALARLMTGRTVLIVAHRLNTVRDADQIAVLDAGRITEVGTHAELLARGGAYARLMRADAPVLGAPV